MFCLSAARVFCEILLCGPSRKRLTMADLNGVLDLYEELLFRTFPNLICESSILCPYLDIHFKNIFMNAALLDLSETDTNFFILNGTPYIFFHFRIQDVILNKTILELLLLIFNSF